MLRECELHTGVTTLQDIRTFAAALKTLLTSVGDTSGRFEQKLICLSHHHGLRRIPDDVLKLIFKERARHMWWIMRPRALMRGGAPWLLRSMSSGSCFDSVRNCSIALIEYLQLL